MMTLNEKCTMCPRNCNIDRNEKEGYCHTTYQLLVSRSSLHMWEEPCISGNRGSGTVFFAGCPLGCIYCQNYNISAADVAKEITVDRLTDIFLELQEKGAHNINLVTPTHYSIHIKEALIIAKNKGLKLPIVYNCSGYEKVNTLKELEGLIDIYLTDFKYVSSDTAYNYSKARDYFEVASKALEEMHRQQPKPVFDEDGMMKCGIIARHLLLPGHVAETKKVIKYLYKTYGDDIYISIMNQFTPVRKIDKYPNLNRSVTEREYNKVIDYAIELGVENAFIQEGETCKESFIPEFNLEGV